MDLSKRASSAAIPTWGPTLVPDNNPDRPRPMSWDAYSEAVTSEWLALLDSDPAEGLVQNFLELHPALIPGGSGDVGPGGHHGSEMGAVFRRPVLQGAGRRLEPDFMWVTRSTSLITPILIEIEKPSKQWFRPSDGRPSGEFTQAHDQLNDWRAWFADPDNQSVFRKRFLFHYDFPDRVLEPQFVLIYGRASEFDTSGPHKDPAALRKKRDTQRAANESFMTFDSIRPIHAQRGTLTATMTATGPQVFAFSPLYSTWADVGEDALALGSPDEAMSRSVMMSGERKAYLKGRWQHWAEIEQDRRRNGYKGSARVGGRE